MMRSWLSRGSTSTSHTGARPSHLARQRDSQLKPGSVGSRQDARPSPHRHHRTSTLRSMDRRDRLIEAGMILASELSLEAVLQRIIELAVEITDARYGALGVIGPGGDLQEFITTGITPEEREAIGAPPHD